MEIRGKTISYGSFRKKENCRLEQELTEDINKLETGMPESLVEEIEQKKAQLEELRNKKIDGMLVRSRARWLQDGEKASPYFCNLEKRLLLLVI